MSGKLDQPLDAMVNSQKKARLDQRRRKRQANQNANAPVGGVKKTTKPVKSAVKTPTAPAANKPRNSKIVVSGLPDDVNEALIKDYFSKSIGPIKTVSLRYNQNGQSRGVADIVFQKPDAAAKAAKDLNGMLVDKRPMKIEVVVEASNVPEPASAKSLAERVTANPKAQPKSATATKANAKNASNTKAGNRPGKPKRTRNNRPKKTLEELDAEMTDYMGGANNGAMGTVNAAASTGTTAVAPAAEAAPAGDDMGMDEIS